MRQFGTTKRGQKTRGNTYQPAAPTLNGTKRSKYMTKADSGISVPMRANGTLREKKAVRRIVRKSRIGLVSAHMANEPLKCVSIDNPLWCALNALNFYWTQLGGN